MMPLAFAVLPLVAAAPADPVVFDNSDQTFVWDRYIAEIEEVGAYLMINEPPTQDGAYDVNGLRQAYDPSDFTPRFHTFWVKSDTGFKPPGTGRIVLDLEPIVLLDEFGDEVEFYFATVFAPGDIVGPGQNFDTYGVLGTWNWSADPDVMHAILQDSYVGVSFKADDGTHYGWIRLWLQYDGEFPWIYHPVAWGYESEPDTAIVIPSDCYADFTDDGVLDLFDFLGYVNAFNAQDPAADCNGDESLDLFDFLCFTNAFNEGC